MRTNKEKIMSQNKQVQKVKLYRTLKVVFYCLGLPLFFVAVFLSSIKFIGHNPFVGEKTWSLFGRLEMLITAPALYGVWIALGIWLAIAIVHIILTKVVKNRRVVRYIVVSLTLVAMLGSALVMDYMMSSHIDEMIEMVANDVSYASGVKINDYKTQLSFYNIVTTGADGKSLTLAQIEKIETLLKAYNVNMQGGNNSGTAGNMGNNAVYYDELIYVDANDNVTIGVDIGYNEAYDKNGNVDVTFALEEVNKNTIVSGGTHYYVEDNIITGDGDRTNDHVLVRLVPNQNGQLEINGKVYEHYYYKRKAPVNASGDPDMVSIYEWYTYELAPTYTVTQNEKYPSLVDVQYTITDGIYGQAIYNSTGLLADGWVFSLENVLEILEDYYAKDSIVARAIEASGENDLTASAWHNQIIADATEWREAYYNGERPDANGNYITAFEQALYQQDITINNAKFSLTREELDALVAELGALLGDNALFDFLLSEDGLLGQWIGPALDMLKEGCMLGELLGQFGVDASGFMPTVCDVFEVLLGKEADTISDIGITLKYKTEDMDHLFLSITDQNGNILIDIDFDNTLLSSEDGDYAFDLDHLDDFLNTALNNAIDTYLPGALSDGGIVDTVLGLLSTFGLDIEQYITKYNIITDGKFTIDVCNILQSVLEELLYWYQSPFVKPLYEFYVNPDAEEWEQQGQKAFADYDRAYYTATVYGPMIGSTLIGSSIGSGKYTSSFGLTSLAAVQQVKIDLSYVPTYYPLYALRDCLYTLSGVVVLFMFMSFVAAEKEMEYASGNLVVKDSIFDKLKKRKKAKKGEDLDENTQDAPDAQTDANVGEDTAIPVDTKSNKEVR